MGTNYFINPPLGWRGLGDRTDRSEFPDNPIYQVGDVIPIHYITNFTSSTCFLFQDFAKKRRIGERVFGPAKPLDGHQRFNWTVDTGRFSIRDSNVFFLVVSSPDQDLIYSHYFNLTRAQGQPEPVSPQGISPDSTVLPIADPVGGEGMPLASGLKLPVVLGLVGGIIAGLTLILLGGFFLLRYYRTKRENSAQDYMETRRKSRMMDRTEDPNLFASGGAGAPETSQRSDLGSFQFDFERGAPTPAPEPKASGARQPESEGQDSNDPRFAGFRVFTKASGRVKELKTG